MDKRKKPRAFIKNLIICVVMCFFVTSTAMVVHASSWVDKENATYKELYGEEVTSPEADDERGADDKPVFVEKLFSELFESLAKYLNNESKVGVIDYNVENVVFGRLSYSIGSGEYMKADFTHFGLEENNPWGIIGATIYYSLRNICLAVMPTILMIMLIRQLLHNDAKNRAQLKEMAQHTVLLYALLFAMPYILDLVIYIRDGLMYIAYQGLHSLLIAIRGESASYPSMMETLFEMQDGHLLNAFLLAAAAGAGIFFLADYIRIAFLLMGAFGIFPIICVISLWYPKKMLEWVNVVFPNLMVTFFDMIGVVLPSILGAIYYRIFGQGGQGSAIIIAIFSLIIMWSTVLIRNRLVRLLGFDGLGRNTGGGALAAVAAVAGRLLRGGGNSSGSERTEEETPKDNEAKREQATAIGQEMDSAVDDLIEDEDSDIFSSPDSGSGSDTDNLLDEMDDDFGGEGDGFEDYGFEDYVPDDEQGEDFYAGDGADDTSDLEGADGSEKADEGTEGGSGADGGASGDESSVGGDDADSNDDGGAMPADVPGFGTVSSGGGMDGMLSPEEIRTLLGYAENDFSQGGDEGLGKPPVSLDGTEGEFDITEGTSEDSAENDKEGTAGNPDEGSLEDTGTTGNPSEDFSGEPEKSEEEGYSKPKEVDYSSHYDSDFAETTLNGRSNDVARYENLARRDALRDAISSNEKTMHSVGYSSERYEDDKRNLEKKSADLQSGIDLLSEKKEKLESQGKQNTEEYGQVTGALDKKQKDLSDTQGKIERLDSARQADEQNTSYRKELAECDRSEAQYAEASGYSGGSSKTYDSADAFKQEQKIEDVRQRVVPARPEDSSGVSRVDYSSHYDSDFAETTLSGRNRDVMRYENLARRDSLRSAISSNERTIREAGYSRDRYEDDRRGLEKKCVGLGMDVDSLKGKKQQLESQGMRGTEEYGQVTEALDRKQRDLSDTQRRIEGLDRAKHADIENAAYQKELAKCDRNELRFADIHGYDGVGSTKTFASADAYRHQQRVDAIKRQQADYRNFDSKQFRGLFTPEEEAEYRRQKEENRYRDAAARLGASAVRGAAKAVVGGTIGAAGMFIGAYGGMGTSMAAGVLGARAGGALVDAAEHVPEVAAAGAQIARDSVMAAYQRDRAVFTSSSQTSSSIRQHSMTAQEELQDIYERADRESERSVSRERSEPQNSTQSAWDELDGIYERADRESERRGGRRPSPTLNNEGDNTGDDA